MDSSLRGRFERLARTQAFDEIPYGSPAVIALRPVPQGGEINALLAIGALARRGVGLLKAKHVIEECLQNGRTLVHVPKVEDANGFAAELAKSGFQSSEIGRGQVDVRALRARLGLTQEQFALRFGLDLNSVQNWETGRRKPDAAVRSYLAVIDRIPDRVGEALEEALPNP